MVIDTDVIIRYLTNDDEKKASRFEAFLASGKKATLTDVTFAEIYWTLLSFYKVKKTDALIMLETLVHSPALSSNANILLTAIALLRQRTVSFIDAYTAAVAQQSDHAVLSYDRGYDKILGIKRVEP